MAAIEIGAFSRPKQEREVSGDAYVVHKEDHGYLFSLIDGLGSGEEAAKASRIAVAQVKAQHHLPLTEILRHCHRSLRNTRGVVMGLLRVNEDTGQVRYAGVGNSGIWVLAQEPFRPISYNGIVGYRLPHVREFGGAYHSGDTFILYSDGVDSRFHSDEALFLQETDPQRLAEQIGIRYGKDNDDVCVLVAR